MKRGDPASASWPGQGYSLIELMFAVAVLATVAAIAIPALTRGLDGLRARGAVRFLSARLQQARMEAVLRNASTGLRFVRFGDSYAYTAYVDGNRNGIRTVDIDRGLDRTIRPEERLRDQFPGVDFGTLPGAPAVDGSGPPPGSDPIRLAASNMVVFTPDGTATAGSLYVLGPRRLQFVVRIYADTGKTKILELDSRTNTWKPL